MNLISLDAKTLVGILVWGNLATGIIVLLYRTFSIYKTDITILRNMSILRFLEAFGYLLLFLRNTISDNLSVNAGNTLLFICFFLEARLLLEITGHSGRKTDIAGGAILAVSVLVFNVMEFIYRDPAIRVLMASIIIFALWLPSTVILMATKNTNRFKKSISVFYVFLLYAVLIRSISYFFDSNLNINTNSYYQSLLFISLNLMMIANVVIYLLFMKEQSDKVIEHMAHYDYLTELLNRYSFFEQGYRMLDHASKASKDLVLLYFDLDFFKNVNDTYGHGFGDEVLLAFTEVIKINTRPRDLCCRYGGEEFILLLPDTGEESGKVIAELIMCSIESHNFASQPGFHITASAGYVKVDAQSGETLEDFIHKADMALYHAKQTGRNKMVDYDKEVPV